MSKYLFLIILTGNILFAVSVRDGITALNEKNYEKAYSIFQKSCKLKNPSGCYNLAVMYDLGKGIKKENEKAIELYEMSCKNGIINGCFNLGVIYDKGNIVQKNMKKAIDYYSIACEKGNYRSCYNIAVVYLNSKEKDYHKARIYFEKACNDLYKKGCKNSEILINKGY